jgi:hypothetical protein
MGGGLLSKVHIHKILSNPFYVGRVGYKSQVREGHHKPIVRQEMWEHA